MSNACHKATGFDARTAEGIGPLSPPAYRAVAERLTAK
jgi:hypothetical protein